MINEEKILKYWKDKDIFHKSIKNREGCSFFSFYDGPPFATGKPHYGHILATTIKDTILRYWTMKGYQVPRRIGWDCHGLPIENLIEKEMGIKNKKEIEEMGVEKFNDACKASVFACVDDFESILKRVGRWADYDKAYSTMENNYIESVWWVLSQLWNKDLVSKKYRVSPYCPRCGTTLSNFEVNQGYKETRDKSIYIKFKTNQGYFLVWTTTPWTLPGNVALVVNPEMIYCLVENNNEKYILAKERLFILDGDYKIINEIKGKELIGLKYEPMFDYLKNTENIENAFQVVSGDFVSSDNGTGIVHMNPMYGEDDFDIGKKYNLPFFHTVDSSGNFKEEVYDFKGDFVKDADEKIINKLKDNNVFYKEEIILHEYPYCWRCDSPLLYYATESWYVSVVNIKDQLIKNNKEIHWVPDHIKEGRFGKWLEGARDWNFSRNRFWGTPIPIWECEECKEIICINSIEDLERKTNFKLKDLHLPYIDEVKIECPQCKKEMKRTSGVFDCWFESGSMPYAQWHYPFENKELVEKTFPADFIAEGLDQTRGWFYTLHVLATALTMEDIGLGKNKPAFKNVIVNGLILDEKGRKLSKKLKNYPDPKEVFDKYGADALRMFLLSSTSIGEDYRFSEERVKEVWRKIISSIENCYSFYETYKGEHEETESNNVLDKWIMSKIEKLNEEIVNLMDDYELTKSSRLFYDFLDNLSNWYIRRSRKRFQKAEEIKEASFTLNYVLLKLSKLIAPFTPFIAEEIFLKLDNSTESVHLSDYPQIKKQYIDDGLEKEMQEARDIVNLVLRERSEKGIKVRQPLNCLKIKKEIKKDILDLIKEEINVKEIIVDKSISNEVELDLEITEELKEEGMIRDIVRHIQQMRKEQGFIPKDRIIVHYQNSDFFDKILLKNKEGILKDTLGDDFKNEASIVDGKEVLISENKIILKIEKI